MESLGFQKIVPENVADAAYSSDIWRFFKVLKIPADFLNTPSDTWNNNQSYLKGLQISKHIKVCNDLAERAIKLIQDYCYQAKSEYRIQDIVQVVEKIEMKYRHYVKNAQKQIKSLVTMNSPLFLFINSTLMDIKLECYF